MPGADPLPVAGDAVDRLDAPDPIVQDGRQFGVDPKVAPGGEPQVGRGEAADLGADVEAVQGLVPASRLGLGAPTGLDSAQPVEVLVEDPPGADLPPSLIGRVRLRLRRDPAPAPNNSITSD